MFKAILDKLKNLHDKVNLVEINTIFDTTLTSHYPHLPSFQLQVARARMRIEKRVYTDEKFMRAIGHGIPVNEIRWRSGKPRKILLFLPQSTFSRRVKQSCPSPTNARAGPHKTRQAQLRL